jgi:predicted phosphohydrolase
MTTRKKDIISFMDLNTDNPAEALPQRPRSWMSKLWETGPYQHQSTGGSGTDNSIHFQEKKPSKRPPILHRLAKSVLSKDPYHQFTFELPSESDFPCSGNEKHSKYTTNLSDCIKIVCLADTFSSQVEVPHGDVLIHAGNLTRHGTFREMQNMLNWLNTLPHRHKILVAGNHDLVLDGAFMDSLRESRAEIGGENGGRGYGGTKEELDFGDVVYLEDRMKKVDVWVRKSLAETQAEVQTSELETPSPSASKSKLHSAQTGDTSSTPGTSFRTTMIEEVPSLTTRTPESRTTSKRCFYLSASLASMKANRPHRQFTIFGTPWTASPSFSNLYFYAHSAFQTDLEHLTWSKAHNNRIPDETNILVAHGPPRFHGDMEHCPGSVSLLREVHRVKPWLVVTGHSSGQGQGLCGRSGISGCGIERTDRESEHERYPIIETVTLNGTRIAYERILEKDKPSFEGWMRLAGMVCVVAGKNLILKTEKAARKLVGAKKKVLRVKDLTTFVNAGIGLQCLGGTTDT